MSDLDTTFNFLIIFLVALFPAFLYLLWIRGTERYRTATWGTILSAFVYGAFVATLVAATIEGILLDVGTTVSQALPAPEFTFLNGNSTAGQFFLILVIAPFVEEGLKGIGVVLLRNRIALVADGPVFGASVGLGFGFFETVLYGIVGFAVGGLSGAILLVLVRSISSVLMHGSSTAMFGYGYAKSRVDGEAGATGRYYLLAVGMHASFNALASIGAILIALGVSNSIGDLASGIALLAAIGFAAYAFEHVAKVIRATDYPALSVSQRGYRAPVRRPPPS
jgi:RsiW-degrading membrane proteinase PrsW (M82 family)